MHGQNDMTFPSETARNPETAISGFLYSFFMMAD